MIRFFLVLIRKLIIICKAFSKKFLIFWVKNLYPSRIKINDILDFGKDFSILLDASNSKVAIGSNVTFRDYCQLRSGADGTLKIGENNFFNNNCSINCLSNISIGSDCQFGEGVKMYDHNHNHSDNTKHINQQGYTYGSITIGNNCWFGSNVIILKGVEIGDNVIIGAGCVIYKSVPANSVVINKQNLDIKYKFS